MNRNPRIELRTIKEGRLAMKPEIMIQGAHGDEIVRSLFAEINVRVTTTVPLFTA
jgi:hypothetical protein